MTKGEKPQAPKPETQEPTEYPDFHGDNETSRTKSRIDQLNRNPVTTAVKHL